MWQFRATIATLSLIQSSGETLAETDARLDGMKLAPMLAASGTSVPDDASWAFEPKWDGLRTLVRIGPDLDVRIQSREGRGFTRSFPELAGMGHVVGRSAVLDGETIVLDADHRPSYERLAARLRSSTPERAAWRGPATFVAFDLLELDGEPLVELPWWLRRELLEGLDWRGASAVPTMVCDDGPALLSATAALGVEGVVCKRRRARYVCGRRTTAWVKVKNPGSGWFDVVGWRPVSRSHPAGAVILADEGRPAGTALPGMPADQRAILHDFVARHGLREGSIVRVTPAAQVYVEYAERSPRGLVRQAVARRLRAALPGTF
jgi:bifunctional non-homologous end joining protein LigD